MNSKNSKTSEPYRLLFNLLDKINLKRSDKCIAVSNLSMYKNKNNKFKISARTWNKKFELPDRTYSLSDIQD